MKTDLRWPGTQVKRSSTVEYVGTHNMDYTMAKKIHAPYLVGKDGGAVNCFFEVPFYRKALLNASLRSFP